MTICSLFVLVRIPKYLVEPIKAAAKQVNILLIEIKMLDRLDC